MEDERPAGIRGRGVAENPANRFTRLHVIAGGEVPDPDGPGPRTRFFRDTSRSAITSNDSPDVGFSFSVNPYRGCEHGCSYCYARPTHEYLGFSSGLDFETRIMVKEDVPELLRKELGSPRWRPAPIGMSGVTDPYQPVERRLRLTRRCLEVLVEFRNPVAVVTKGSLVTRDVDLLGELAGFGAAAVFLSITTLDAELQRAMEPRASAPRSRLDAIRRLSDAGIPTGVLVAPLIPGLTDHELPAILEASAEAGASAAGFIPLRLPQGNAELFQGWLQTHRPGHAAKVLGRIRDMRGGQLNDPRFGFRMRGEGPYAEQLRALFHVTCRRLGLDRKRTELSTAAFRRPDPGGQLALFE